MDGSAPTGRVLTVKGASIIQLEGENFLPENGDEQLGPFDIRKDSIKTRRLII